MAPAEIVFFAASGILVGMFSASVGWSLLAVLAVVLCGEAVIYYVRRTSLLRAGVFIGAIFCGAFYFHLYAVLDTTRGVFPQGAAGTFMGVVVSEPMFTPKTQQFRLRLEEPFTGDVRIVTDQSREFRYGDLLAVSGTLTLSSYRGRASYESVFPYVRVLGSGHGAWLKEKLLGIKSLALGVFRRTLPHDEAALMSGITLGARSDFNEELKSLMARSGTTHLVALSGYNISILAIVVAGFFGALFRRRTVFILTVLTIIGFVLMVGAEASVVRAALMGFLALVAREVGREYSMKNAIVLAAVAMAFHNPSVLAFDVGFQLSFLSLLGIVLLEPALRRLTRFGDHPGMLGWRDNLLTTISAQAAVLPILVVYFGDASAMAFLANILILSIVPLTMAIGFLLAVVGTFFAYLGNLVALIAQVPLAYILGVIHFSAAVPASLHGFFSTWWLVAMYYVVLLGVVYYAQHHGEARA